MDAFIADLTAAGEGPDRDPARGNGQSAARRRPMNLPWQRPRASRNAAT
jgi:hypothetical protein